MRIKDWLASVLTRSPKHAPRVYDDVAYRYSSEEAGMPAPPGTLESVLGFAPARDDLRYVLGFFAGGIGVDDDLAIRCRCDGLAWNRLVERLHLKTLAEVGGDARWVSDFDWLVGAATNQRFTRRDCEVFIDANRCDFQDAADGRAEIRFSQDSDVNTWCAVWRVDGNVNYRARDQG